jgi:hypothetical protein
MPPCYVQLVFLLDRSKTAGVLPTDPCLFSKV